MLRIILPIVSLLIFIEANEPEVPNHYKVVDQVVWVVDDLNGVIEHWRDLGFEQVILLDTVKASFKKAGQEVKIRMALANLAGARIAWIQSLEEESLFSKFFDFYGGGAMSLVHRLPDHDAVEKELMRLKKTGVSVLDRIKIKTPETELNYVFMDTYEKGKYVLGFTFSGKEIFSGLSSDNRHGLKINQYAFAIRDTKEVSHFWSEIGLPEFQINYPELGNMHYYGKPTDHELYQGWQRHGTVDYEWCIPVKPPIVYDDHIKKHNEGIHHLAFSVRDMDTVLNDFISRGYVNTMGGTWGNPGQPGSGRYEYIGMEDAGGVTIELLWNFSSD